MGCRRGRRKCRGRSPRQGASGRTPRCTLPTPPHRARLRNDPAKTTAQKNMAGEVNPSDPFKTVPDRAAYPAASLRHDTPLGDPLSEHHSEPNLESPRFLLLSMVQECTLPHTACFRDCIIAGRAVQAVQQSSQHSEFKTEPNPIAFSLLQ